MSPHLTVAREKIHRGIWDTKRNIIGFLDSSAFSCIRTSFIVAEKSINPSVTHPLDEYSELTWPTDREYISAVVKRGVSAAGTRFRRARGKAISFRQTDPDRQQGLRRAGRRARRRRDRHGDPRSPAAPQPRAQHSSGAFRSALPVVAASGVAAGGGADYYAFVLSHRCRTPPVIALGPAEALDRLVSRWHEELTAGAGAGQRLASLDRYREKGAALRRAVWDVVSGRIGESSRVSIVPHGALNLVDFSTLPVGSDDYLVDGGPELHYLSAERDLAFFFAAPYSVGLLAVGGSDYDDRSAGAPADRPVPPSAGGLHRLARRPVHRTPRRRARGPSSVQTPRSSRVRPRRPASHPTSAAPAQHL
jgi:hypothetical protein